MAAAAQPQSTPTEADPVQRWLARRSACSQIEGDQLDAKMTGPPAPSLPATYSREPAAYPTAQRAQRAAINRANSTHSTGPRTESGKQRSSLNAFGHSLTART